MWASIKTLSSSLNFDYAPKIKADAALARSILLGGMEILLSMILIKINMKNGQPELNDAVNEIAR